LLQTKNVAIPNYQRPYKWTNKNVHQLIDDILTFKEKPAYRLGTVVYHLDEGGKLNIVDGQQRTLTLLLIALAIEKNSEISIELRKNNVNSPNLNLVHQLKFTNQITKRNLRDNYREIAQRIK